MKPPKRKNTIATNPVKSSKNTNHNIVYDMANQKSSKKELKKNDKQQNLVDDISHYLEKDPYTSKGPAASIGQRSSTASFAQLRKTYLARQSISRPISIAKDMSEIADAHSFADNKSINDSHVSKCMSIHTYGDVASVLYGYHNEWRGEEEEELEQLENSRRIAARNFLQCVKKHLQALLLLKNSFADPLLKKVGQSSSPLATSYSGKRVDSIFSCTMKLIPFHKFLLRDAEQAIKQHDYTGTLEGISVAINGHMAGFRYYLHYLQEYPKMIGALEQLYTENSTFKKTLNECSKKADHANVRALLGGPKEHIGMYYLLLQKLVDLYSPEDPEYIGFMDCFREMQDIKDEANTLLRIGQQKEAVVQIQASLDGLGDVIVTGSRRLIYQGNLNRIVMPSGNIKQRICFLFNDQLIFAKEKKDGKRSYKGRIYLNKAKVREIPGDKYPHTFGIIDSVKKEFYFQAESSGFRHRWINYLREMIHNPYSIETSGMAGPSFVSLPQPNMPLGTKIEGGWPGSRSQLGGPLRIRNVTSSMYSNNTEVNTYCSTNIIDLQLAERISAVTIKTNDYERNPEHSPVPDAVPVASNNFHLPAAPKEPQWPMKKPARANRSTEKLVAPIDTMSYFATQY
ncbi:hypothetical protein BDF19DRAFT_462968 [Syncephalis fuscata]|nr:hypothetical protein BDF19DRAFT_462968 [Syncephalis fuscata]